MPKKLPNSFYRYTGIATKMMTIVLVFVIAGLKADEWLGNTEFPLFTLIGALLGPSLAIYTVIKDLGK